VVQKWLHPKNGSIIYRISDCWDENAEFSQCGTACESQCGKAGVNACMGMCVSGCFCKSGFIKDFRGMCISGSNCDQFVKSSECLSALAEINSHDEPLIGGFVPKCEPNGNYSPKQGHGSTGYSWCAHRNGTKIENTDVPPGQKAPDCIRR